MNRICVILSLVFLVPGFVGAGQEGKAANPSLVKVVQGDGKFQLLHNGQPYFIKGVGGSKNLELLVRMGGNSIRTWGTDNLEALLNEAQRLGLTVTAGIWLGHERHGFNYNNADQVAKQYETVRQTVLKFKDHPALLLWGLGNEMEGFESGDNAAIWSAINNIAGMVKRIDPDHPTMTVMAEIGGNRVKSVHRLCPDIDIVGINSYGGLPSLPKRYREAGGTRPFIVTEFGPPGAWEVQKNTWGAPPEPTSTAKADFYRKGHQEGILAAKGLCLGAYAFLWGNKQEATATWFGMLLPDGSRLAAADTMQELWTGKPPQHPCPRIEGLKVEGADQVEPGAQVQARMSVAGANGEKLRIRWVLQADAASESAGEDEEVPQVYPDAILKGDSKQAEIRMPKGGGGYRLFAYVQDEHGGAAVANVPLFVKGPVIPPLARQATLPLVIFGDSDQKHPVYVPSGWMGNNKGLQVDAECTEKPHKGKTCMRVEYRDKEGWAGVVWQSPANNWGDRPGGWNLTGARKLTFWGRGASGGEIVSFEFGLIARDKKFSDSGKGKLEKIQLTREWRQYTIDLGNQDLSRILTGFAFVIAGQGVPVVFYLDEIKYE